MEAVISPENTVVDFINASVLSENTSTNSIVKQQLESAKGRLLNGSLPHRKKEDWKYSKIAPWLKKKYSSYRSNENFDLKKIKSSELKANTLVFVNGYFRDDLSTISNKQEGVHIQNMTEAEDLFTADIEQYFGKGIPNTFFNDLNTLYHGNGVFIKVNDNVVSENLIHLLHIQTGSGNIAQARNLIILGKNSQLEILESQFEHNCEESISNHVSEYFIGENAALNYALIQEGTNNAMIHTNQYVQADFSKLNANVFSLQNALIRNNHSANILGKDCETRLNGSFMPGKGEQIDNRTLLDHQNVRGFSEEVYKGILFEKSNAVFNGKIFVDQKAQQTNAYLNNSNILMDDSSRMQSKPELEIYADDVKCSHGSATGDFDTEALFYLQTRGIGIDKGRNMLIHAFMDEVLSKVENEDIRNCIQWYLDAKMLKLDK
jgi:Fe-S cluster assembly protein SufD